MMNQGCECQACFSKRTAYFLYDYGPTPMCWVCKLVLICPAFMSDPIYWVFGGGVDPKDMEPGEECGACGGSGMMGSTYPPYTQPCICPLGKQKEGE